MSFRIKGSKLKDPRTRPKSLSPSQLECHKWGFKRWGFKQIRGYPRKKGLFPQISSGFSRCCSGPPEKGEKGRFWLISGTGGQTPLRPPFVTPPFAAAQLRPLENISLGASKSFAPPKICKYLKTFYHREDLQEWPR